MDADAIAARAGQGIVAAGCGLMTAGFLMGLSIGVMLLWSGVL